MGYEPHLESIVASTLCGVLDVQFLINFYKKIGANTMTRPFEINCVPIDA